MCKSRNHNIVFELILCVYRVVERLTFSFACGWRSPATIAESSNNF
ncbi:MAG: hypothetical protein RMY28_001730 [Nostoc sp. ChiSLP01]|nr:hypothetical protein [Nostoc sp. CmiSLP01]MDZ8282226.1 hypothetical protein [Nostoc sp. ChiSLP01]